jgi:hypothetical protein
LHPISDYCGLLIAEILKYSPKNRISKIGYTAKIRDLIPLSG